MKKTIIFLFALTSLIGFSCTDAFDNTSDSKKIEKISVNFYLTMGVDDLKSSNLKLYLKNYEENIDYEFPVDGKSVPAKDIIPGVYTVSVVGEGVANDETEFIMNGNLVNLPLLEDNKNYDVRVRGIMLASLIFKELYYAGVPSYYFRDQFYEIYNNSENLIYLDGICFANLEPTTATEILPTWPDGTEDYVYADRIWKFPGNGTDYPLQPGESVVLAQCARNHMEHNANTKVDLSIAEFEFYTGSTSYPDMEAINMEHVYYDGQAGTDGLMQYMVSVFGGAYAIFKVPEGENWDPINDPKWSVRQLGSDNSQLYAKIPIEYVWDAVELGDNESMVKAKRIPGLLDAGMSWVGNIYCGLSVARHIAKDANGNLKKMENGSYIYQDTNNSTNDFVPGIEPEIRRNDALMPSWNHTLQ